jgi:Mn2+/Fe2+ NRAMP family transporter
MRLSAVLEEGFELLRWSVLAASTIGPGTVIVCSKAGADYALTLLWALVLASFVAYALQEGAARLSLLGRTTLGRAMRTMWGGGAESTPAGCRAVAAGVLLGNTAYQANNFVGAAEALYALGAPRSDPGVRFLMHLACGLAVLGCVEINQ